MNEKIEEKKKKEEEKKKKENNQTKMVFKEFVEFSHQEDVKEVGEYTIKVTQPTHQQATLLSGYKQYKDELKDKEKEKKEGKKEEMGVKEKSHSQKTGATPKYGSAKGKRIWGEDNTVTAETEKQQNKKVEKGNEEGNKGKGKGEAQEGNKENAPPDSNYLTEKISQMEKKIAQLEKQLNQGKENIPEEKKTCQEGQNNPLTNKKVFHPSDHPNWEEGLKRYQKFVKEYEQMKASKKGKGKSGGNQSTIPYKRGSWRHQQDEEPHICMARTEQEYYEDNYGGAM